MSSSMLHCATLSGSSRLSLVICLACRSRIRRALTIVRYDEIFSTVIVVVVLVEKIDLFL